jgi:hypothetical protein
MLSCFCLKKIQALWCQDAENMSLTTQKKNNDSVFISEQTLSVVLNKWSAEKISVLWWLSKVYTLNT